MGLWFRSRVFMNSFESEMVFLIDSSALCHSGVVANSSEIMTRFS